MEDLFEITGQTAIILMATSGINGIFGAKIRKIIKDPWVYTVHKCTGIGALAFGIIHALIYWVFLD
ncbi:MAG: hypothetical protein Q7I97_08375 [Thermovirgaceae bacterium]|nr:hypothetical protein [Thermovirgaceae bacterium]